MFKRVRQLRISLAAKCQLLFGAAVILIIAAALYVPGRRVEQLTGQLNERSARTLVDYAVARHIAEHESGPDDGSTTTQPAASTRPAPLATDAALVIAPPTTAPLRAPSPGVAARTADAADPDDVPEDADADATGPPSFRPPRFILARTSVDLEAARADLTPFEQYALDRLLRRPGREFVAGEYRAAGGEIGYRFARVFDDCTRCHGPAIDGSRLRAGMDGAPATTGPPAELGEPLLGLVAVDIPSQVEINQLLLNRVFLLLAGLLAGTLAIIVFYLITTRLILQPVRVLQETAEKVSEGDLNIRSDISTGDEFQQLSETFNTMLANLKKSSDQLRQVNKSLDLKLGQLAETNVALYESNRLKSEFLANVSHELRTPLNSILGFAELLRETTSLGPEAKAARYVQNILHSGRNLLDLINDLLDLAKIEAGRMDVRSEPLSLGDLFEGLISLLKPLSEARRVTIAVDVAADVPIIRTDPPKLQQILYNFLSNAIKFSPMGGHIALSAERREGGVRIAVTDRGPGIDANQQQLIFEKFRQLDASATREHGGTGLGLAISKELTNLLGGTIGVDSVPGQGATFYVILPLGIDAAQHDVRQTLALTG